MLSEQFEFRLLFERIVILYIKSSIKTNEKLNQIRFIVQSYNFKKFI